MNPLLIAAAAMLSDLFGEGLERGVPIGEPMPYKYVQRGTGKLLTIKVIDFPARWRIPFAQAEEMIEQALEDHPGLTRAQVEEALEAHLEDQGIPRIGGESMWVRVIEGDENEGVGMLVNNPAYWSGGSLGSVVRYAEGTDTTKPRFIEVITDDSHG